MERESLQVLLDQGWSLDQIGARFGRHPSTVSYWMAKYGLSAANREKHAVKGGVGREHLERLVEAGMSVAGIAGELNRSTATIRHWLRRYGIRTRTATRTEAVMEAKEAGQLTVQLLCPHHGQTDHVLEGRGHYRCKQCRSKRVTDRRRKLKQILVAEAGGRCSICGYDRYLGALEFHHRSPEDKRLEISRNGSALSLEAVRAEAQKCVLLCSNCHAEVEAGVVQLVAKMASGEAPIHLNPG